MKHNVFFGIAIRIIILFSIFLFGSFIPENLREFFGDTINITTKYGTPTDEYWHWGTRHYWYAIMVICLFLLSIANLIIYIIHILRKNYDFFKW